MCHDMPWYAMICHDMPWYAMICHDMPWYAMICHGSLNVTMFHITQPLGIHGLLDGYYFWWCPLYSQVMGHLPTPVIYHDMLSNTVQAFGPLANDHWLCDALHAEGLGTCLPIGRNPWHRISRVSTARLQTRTVYQDVQLQNRNSLSVAECWSFFEH